MPAVSGGHPRGGRSSGGLCFHESFEEDLCDHLVTLLIQMEVGLDFRVGGADIAEVAKHINVFGFV